MTVKVTVSEETVCNRVYFYQHLYYSTSDVEAVNFFEVFINFTRLHGTTIPADSGHHEFCILVTFVQVETAVGQSVQTVNLLVQERFPTTQALPIMATGRNIRPTIPETRSATVAAAAATAARREGAELLSPVNNCSNWRGSFMRRNI
jgi:hypothetical protein